jgi:hypothetical protein
MLSTVIWFDFGVKNSSRLARTVNNNMGNFSLNVKFSEV